MTNVQETLDIGIWTLNIPGKMGNPERDNGMSFLSLIVFLALAYFWCRQFIDLMLMPDSDFPGKYDKILWVLAFCALFFLTPFAFVFWKQSYLVTRKPRKDSQSPKLDPP